MDRNYLQIPYVSAVYGISKSYANQKTDGTSHVDLVDRRNGNVIARTVYEPYADQILAAIEPFLEGAHLLRMFVTEHGVEQLRLSDIQKWIKEHYPAVFGTNGSDRLVAAFTAGYDRGFRTQRLDKEKVARALHKRFCLRAQARVTHNPDDKSCYSNNTWEQLPPSMQKEYLEDAEAVLGIGR